MRTIQNESNEEKDDIQGLENDKKEKEQATKSYLQTQAQKIASFSLSIPDSMENHQ